MTTERYSHEWDSMSIQVDGQVEQARYCKAWDLVI